MKRWKSFCISVSNPKKILAIFMILFLLLPEGCTGKEEEQSDILRVGIVTYSQDDPYINALTDTLKEELKKKETEDMSVMVSIKSGGNDQEDQDEVVEEMIDAGCDILCVNLVDRTAPSKIIKMAKENEIPVLFFNREPVREDLFQWEHLYYIGCEAEQSGVIQGKLAADYIKAHPELDRNQDGKIQYVMLVGEAGHQDSISRTEVSVKTLMEQGIELEKLTNQFADWNRGQAENRVNRIISQYGDSVELILSNNDEMALGAVEAYESAGIDSSKWPALFGIDGLPDALEAIKDGKIQGTVYQDREDQARQMARMIWLIYQDQSLDEIHLEDEKYYTAQYRRVDESNVDSFVGR